MNRQRMACSIISLCLLPVLFACTEKTPAYFPLEPGTGWQYKAVISTMDTTEKQKYFISNIPARDIDGKEVYVQKTLRGNEILYGEDDSGVFQLGYIRGDDPEQNFIADKHYLFPYPLTPGSVWQDSVNTMALRKTGPRAVTIVERVPVQAKLVSVNEKVRVATGRFSHCLRIERTGELMIPVGRYQYVQETVIRVKDIRWYAPGVGLVKSVRTETTQSSVLDHSEYTTELYAIENK